MLTLDTTTPASAMVVVAHPDDAEFMCAGTVAKWAARGAEVTYVVITKGDKGSDDPAMTPSRLAVIREAEQRAAGAILGVRNFEFLGYEDGYLQPTLELRRDLARLIRRYRPEAVITFDPTNRIFSDSYINHPDHRAAGDACLDAVFPSARDRLTFPELLADGLEPHKVKYLYLAGPAEENLAVDISGTIEQKVEALLAHPSQFEPEAIGFVREMAAMSAAGLEGVTHAERYRRITFDQGFEVPEMEELP